MGEFEGPGPKAALFKCRVGPSSRPDGVAAMLGRKGAAKGLFKGASDADNPWLSFALLS